MRPAARFLEVDLASPEIELSPVLAETLAATAAAEGRPVVLLRRQRPYVLLGPRDRRLPRLADGLRWLAARGLPVYQRIGGGSAVWLDETCLSFAVARPCRDFTETERNFLELADGVRRGLARLGLAARFGAAPGSYCEGPFDLVVGEPPRKLAGVAQAIRGGFALVSGMVLVAQDPARATALLQGFYRASGDGRRLDAAAVTSVERELGRAVDPAEAAAALRAGFSELFALEERPLSALELERARRLAAERRLA
ncbi:MAG: lipoate--protein ligase family protein [Firmicutes bacterium]|nr:lipoate--protein ligase family protein [Bacillota bacterium]